MSTTQDIYIPEDVLIPHFGHDRKLAGIEIGVSGGSGTVGMLYRLPNLTVYCIDPWRHFEGYPYEASLAQEVHDVGYEQALNKLKPFRDRVVVFRETSDEAINHMPEQVDFVHIDGHHEYEQVLRDIGNYLPKIRPGGLMTGHDYGQVPDVTRAVNESFNNRCIIYTGDDFTWWVHR
jgi:predicted O-methyltransferase YrrM